MSIHLRRLQTGITLQAISFVFLEKDFWIAALVMAAMGFVALLISFALNFVENREQEVLYLHGSAVLFTAMRIPGRVIHQIAVWIKFKLAAVFQILSEQGASALYA